MHAPLFNQLHPEWQELLHPHKELIDSIDSKISKTSIAPDRENIFRTLKKSPSTTKVVIFGQDPYPTAGHAHGLAFSVDQSVSKLPASLRNIFEELATDLGSAKRTNGDLSDWSDQGVLLLNRILTTEVGSSMAHAHLGWQEITAAVAHELGKRDVVAILWGKPAGELKSFFRSVFVIESAHPSPLAAYRGFFGSKPFSRANLILENHGVAPINW
ncbi:Ung Uracil DNA glycosylase [Candidatus Nanopelagicaceae bacterium]